MKLSLIDHKSSVLALETFESELDKIMILPLKYNKFFFKPKLLITPQIYCNHQNQFMEQQHVCEFHAYKIHDSDTTIEIRILGHACMFQNFFFKYHNKIVD